MTEFRREIPMNGPQTAAAVDMGTGLGKPNDSVTDHVAPADSKVSITASAQILSGPGVFYGLEVVSQTPGATVRISDSLTSSAPYLSSAITTVTGDIRGTMLFDKRSSNGINMATGCYVTITGTVELIPLVKLD